MKTRKHKNIRRKKTHKRGGTIYSVKGETRARDRWGNTINSILYGKNNINEENITSYTRDEGIKTPYVFADILKNVSIHRNMDKNYKYYGFLMMEIKQPIDFQTIRWTLEKYLTENVLNDPILTKKNKMNLNLTLDFIKINDFRFNYNNQLDDKSKTLNAPITITGSIYVSDPELSAKVEKKLLSKLPQDIVNREIKKYI